MSDDLQPYSLAQLTTGHVGPSYIQAATGFIFNLFFLHTYVSILYWRHPFTLTLYRSFVLATGPESAKRAFLANPSCTSNSHKKCISLTMTSAQVLTPHSQWPSSGLPLKPVHPWHIRQYHPYHCAPIDMGKKRGKGASYRPGAEYDPPNSRHHDLSDNRFAQSQYQPPPPPNPLYQPQQNVSQAGISQLMQSLYGYRNDNTYHQAMPTIPPNPYFTAPAAYGQQQQHYAPPPPQQYSGIQQRQQLNPQANTWQPGRSVGASQHYPVNGVNKYSRYSAPQTRSQRRALQVVADQALPSIEQPASDQARHFALPVRAARTPPWRKSRSATPGQPDRPVTPPVAPTPTQSYLARASVPASRLLQPRKLLVLLDLNGTLLFRPRFEDIAPGKRPHILRPGVISFLKYLFDNHAVMIYTSATEWNAKAMVDTLLKDLSPEQRKKLIDIRPREKLGLTHRQLKAKVQVHKPLEPVWALPSVIANGQANGCVWDDTNTILLDDSIEKAAGNPHSLLQVPEFTLSDGMAQGNMSSAVKLSEQKIMIKVRNKVEALSWEESVTRKIREWQERGETLVGAPSQPVREEEGTKVRAEGSAAAATMTTDTGVNPRTESAGKESDVAAASYPTPISTVEEDIEDLEDEADRGVRLETPAPITEADFGFVEGSKKD